ncbi:MAG: hypothetical protein IJS19_02885 [Muribaculaceae bacterium]|nr:hypothetical protein [Muribaculaceae bacterium]
MTYKISLHTPASRYDGDGMMYESSDMTIEAIVTAENDETAERIFRAYAENFAERNRLRLNQIGPKYIEVGGGALSMYKHNITHLTTEEEAKQAETTII